MERSKSFGSFFNEASGGEGDRCAYPTRLDAYGCGCAHDCSYCYARSLLSFRGLWHPDNPSVASAEYIRRKLDKVKPGSVVRLGGMTDCFQPIEETYRATYQTIKMMNARDIGYLIVTKSPLVASRDYLRIYDPELAHIQISVTSTDDTPNWLGEKAPRPSERVEAAETLQRLGFDVSIRCSPYVPELVDVRKLNKVKVSKCLVEFLRVNTWVEKWTGLSFDEHRVKSGGYRHLPLDRKMELLEGFGFDELTVCEDVPEHYGFFKRNVNANPEDCCNLGRANGTTEVKGSIGKRG